MTDAAESALADKLHRSCDVPWKVSHMYRMPVIISETESYLLSSIAYIESIVSARDLTVPSAWLICS